MPADHPTPTPQANSRPSGRLARRAVLVTGGTSGIGKATVEMFASEGARVAFTGRREDLGRALESKLNGQGYEVAYLLANHTSAEDCQRVVSETVERFGRLDILFNNAGIVVRGTAEQTSERDWFDTMNLNVTAVWRMCRLAIPHMRKRGGAIVNNASDWGLVGGRGAVAYCASKGAVVQMTRAMALDHAHENIRVNAVCPGDTEVERWHREGYFRDGPPVDGNAIHADGLDNPMLRVARPEEIARAVLFLVSDESSFVTGATLVVDGGNTAR